MVAREQIIAELTAFVKKTILKKDVEIGPDDDLQKQVGLDSMGIIEIATKLEDEYHIQFDDSDLRSVKNINTTADLLLRKIGQSQS